MNNNFKTKDYFFNGNDKQINERFHQALDLGIDFVNGKLRNNKILNYESASEIKSWFVDSIPQNGITYDKLLDQLSWVGKYSISQSDKRYLSFPDSANNVGAMMGDIFSKFLNQNLIAFDRSAPISTFVEIQVLEWLRELVGYDTKPVSEMMSLSEVGGMITTGGHMSNHIAMLAALTQRYPETKNDGLSSLTVTPKIAYSSKISHYSHLVASHHLGIGMKNFVNISATNEYKTDIESLRDVLKKDSEGKKEIFYVICVAGNCRTCNIDNIKGMAEVCREYGVWLHVDACHGGALIFSDELKSKYLQSLEYADSISLDPHKGLFVSYPSSAVLFKKRDTLVTFSRYYEKEARDGSSWDLGYLTPFFGSRGHESLKLWCLIKSLGKENLSKILEQRFVVSLAAREYLENSGYFGLLNEVDTYRMAFVYLPKEIKEIYINAKLTVENEIEIKKIIDYFTHKINQELYEEGKLCLDEFKLLDIVGIAGLKNISDKFYVMSLTVGNPLLEISDLESVLAPLFEKCEKYKGEMIEMVRKLKLDLDINSEYLKPAGPAGW